MLEYFKRAIKEHARNLIRSSNSNTSASCPRMSFAFSSHCTAETSTWDISRYKFSLSIPNLLSNDKGKKDKGENPENFGIGSP